MDLNGLAKEAFEIAKAREQNTDVLSCLKHCSGEVVEAIDAYKTYNNFMFDIGGKDRFADELADVIMCILTLSASKNIDIENALDKCLEKNRQRAKFHGFMKDVKNYEVVSASEANKGQA